MENEVSGKFRSWLNQVAWEAASTSWQYKERGQRDREGVFPFPSLSAESIQSSLQRKDEDLRSFEYKVF